MAVVTPAIYQELAERGFGPPLDPSVEPIRLPLGFQLARPLLRPYLKSDLMPMSVHRLAVEGGTGVPLFAEHELRAFVSEAQEAPSDEPRHGQWWEFWPTADGSYAMFPGDDAPKPSVATTLWRPAGRSASVRRIEISPVAAIAGPRFRHRPSQREPCELLAKESEPGAPYVGRCSNVGCDDDCSPHVVVHPDDGIYRLLGCDC